MEQTIYENILITPNMSRKEIARLLEPLKGSVAGEMYLAEIKTKKKPSGYEFVFAKYYPN